MLLNKIIDSSLECKNQLGYKIPPKLINLIRYSILTTKKIYFSYSKYFQKNFVLKDWYIPKYDVFYEIKKNNIIVFTDNSKRILNNKINKIKKDNKNYLFVSKVLFNHFNYRVCIFATLCDSQIFN